MAQRKTKDDKASRVAYQQAVREFLEFLGLRANAPIESITERDINAFINHLQKDGHSGTTINKLARQYLSGAFEKARKLGKIKYNPIAATDALPNDSIVKDVFSAEQVARLVKAAKDTDWEGAILLAYGTGARLQDVCNFKWDAIDTEMGWLPSASAKPRSKRLSAFIPISWIGYLNRA